MPLLTTGKMPVAKHAASTVTRSAASRALIPKLPPPCLQSSRRGGIPGSTRKAGRDQRAEESATFSGPYVGRRGSSSACPVHNFPG